MTGSLCVGTLLALAQVVNGWATAAESADSAPSTDMLVFVGAGRIDGWDTRFDLANPSPEQLGLGIGVTPEFPGGCPPLTGCTGYEFVVLPPFGSASTVTPSGEGLTAVYIRTESETLPVVSAYNQSPADPAQAASVPGYRLSTLLAINSNALTFPGARAGERGRSNLVLTNLLTLDPAPPRGGDVTVLIEAYSSEGELLGSMSQTLRVGKTVMVSRVFDQLGGTSGSAGQIVVTRTAGDRSFWGVLYNFDSSGALLAAVGANP